MLFNISFVHWLVILSAFISVGGSIPYIKDTLAGRSKPNRVSWSMWALAPLIATVAALYGHADPWATTRTFLAGFIPLMVFVSSFINKESYWKLTRFDLMCGLCSFAALLVWLIFHSSSIAILLAVIGDGFAAIPTIIKAWKYPETETGTAFIAGFISVLLVFPSIPHWDIQNSGFQIYLFIADLILIFSIYRKRLFRSQTRKEEI